MLPGVTVEASSPALIEKTRTAVTDGQGRYTLPELRPGTTPSPSRSRASATVRREGIEVQASTNVPINVEMQVGAVAETITVSGATPRRRRAGGGAAAGARRATCSTSCRRAGRRPRSARSCPASG